MASVVAAPAFADAPQPYMMFRALQELQTQIVQGKAKAREEQPKMLADIGKQFAHDAAGAWTDPRNARASIVWLLSGGSPRTMRTLLRASTFLEGRPRPGARRARFRGGPGAASARAARVDRAAQAGAGVRRPDRARAGGAGALGGSREINRASRRRKIARARTLVEETALRRQISLVGQRPMRRTVAGALPLMTRRSSRRSMRRNFARLLPDLHSRIGTRASDDQLVSLEPILDTFDVDERCRIVDSHCAREFLEGSWLSAAAFRRGRDASARRSELRCAARAPLSCGGAGGRPDNEADVLALQKLDPARLNAEDRAFRKAALNYAQLARSWPEARSFDDPADIGGRGEDTLAAAESA